MNTIVTEDLTKRYGQRVGIEALDLAVPPGEVFGFLGPNGSGKSTTIRLLLALLKPTVGRASLFGLDCWSHARRIKADIGYVPGDLRLYPWMSTRSALAIFGRVRRRELLAPGAELAGQFELELDVPVRSMSRGMRQKLGLILAFVHEPRLLVLDEPTAALDPLMQEMVYDHLRRRAAAGATVFFSSHMLSEVEQLCDRVAILREGRLVANETLDTLRSRAAREVLVTWSDEETMNATIAPPFLRIEGSCGRAWRATLTGSVVELVRWAAAQRIDDLSIGAPNLETLFRQFYQRVDQSP